MAILSSSPLNLTLDSTSTAPGLKVGTYGPGTNINSLFNTPHKNTIRWTPWPTGKLGTASTGSGSASTTYFGSTPPARSTIHSDEIYDTSINSIINYCQGVKYTPSGGAEWYPMWIKPVDFAYLRDVGVYPNNRIVICRRFDSAVGNDLTQVADEAISTIISWIPDGKDFVDFSFGEKWDAAAVSFTEILNSAGKDAGPVTAGLGKYLEEGAHFIPLPGFTEEMQRKMLSGLKVGGQPLLNQSDSSTIPSGDPNLIKEAKQRHLTGYDDSGSGLKCDFKIEVEAKWEQKFIGNIDPTLAWMDIMQTILRFGTSPSRFYLGSGDVASKMEQFLTEMQNNPIGKIHELIDSMVKAMAEIIKSVGEAISSAAKEVVSNPIQAGNKALTGISDLIKGITESVIRNMIDKYKIKIIGVLRALTGAASGPWHVTIGNPKRPIFCSGDMLCENVTIQMGDKLAFNDLPSSITAKFTLTNARPLGLQEILSRMNTGYARTVTTRKTIDESSFQEYKQQDVTHYDSGFTTNTATGETRATPPVGGQSVTNSGGSSVDSNPGKTASSAGSRVGNSSVNNQAVNSDANATQAIVSDPSNSYNKAANSVGNKLGSIQSPFLT